MRCYKVVVNGAGFVMATRLAGTNASANEIRNGFVTSLQVKKKDVEIEQIEVPMQKGELLEFINQIHASQDNEVRE